MRPMLLASLALAYAAPLMAQHKWSLTLIASIDRYSTAYHDTSTPQINAKPWHPARLGVRFTRDGEHLGIGTTIAFMNAEEGAQIEEVSVQPGFALSSMMIAPELRWRALRTKQEAELVLHAGPTFEVWKPSGTDHRARWGAAGGATLSLPFTTTWRVEVRGEGGVSHSYVNEDEQSDDVRRNSLMRRATLGLGITKRL